jgi:glucose-1-phosphate thymidylyltransferase
MKALVLAGGRGTRLQPFTHTLPKQLIPIGNRPILHYVMDSLGAAGIHEIGIIISPETGERIKEALAANPWGHAITYLRQEEPLGLAHAVRIARDYLSDGPFVMYLGDTLVGEGIGRAVSEFRSSGADALITVKEVADPSHFGVVVRDGNGEIRKLVEKPHQWISNLAVVGIYFFSSIVHSAVAEIAPSARGELEITDAIQLLVEKGCRVATRDLAAWWVDCSNRHDLLTANRNVLETLTQRGIHGDIDRDSKIAGLVRVEPSAVIRKSEIRGPAVIGAGSTVIESTVGPCTSVGPSCRITRSKVERSILLEGAVIEDVEEMRESIVGRRATVRKQAERTGGPSLLIGDEADVRL